MKINKNPNQADLNWLMPPERRRHKHHPPERRHFRRRRTSTKFRPPGNVDELMTLLSMDYRRYNMLVYSAICTPFLFYVGLILTVFGGSTGMVCSAFIVVLLLSILYFYSHARRELIRSIDLISKFDDVRFIGILIEIIYTWGRSLRSSAQTQLIRLMPLLRSTDMNLLDNRQRLWLRLYLGRSIGTRLPNNPMLDLAIVKAYQHIGDGSELPTIRHILMNSSVEVRYSLGVLEAARRYLDIATQRAEAVKQSKMLLRSADEPETMEEMLLRPAASAESDPSLLLRIAVTEDSLKTQRDQSEDPA